MIVSRTFELVIVEPRSGRVVVCPGETFALPVIEGDARGRPAHTITRGASETFHIQTFMLFLLDARDDRPRVVLELISESSKIPSGLVSLSVEELPSELLTASDRHLLSESLSGGVSHLGHYAQFGWLEVLKQCYWHREINLFHQFNCGVDFSLFQFFCRGECFWFKGVGDPNQHEYWVTKLLQQYIPEFMPKIALMIDGWCAWISEAVVGAPLKDEAGVQPWRNALCDLASIQMRTQPYIPRLSDAGARCLTVQAILDDLHPCMAELDQAMQAQTSTKAAPLSRNEIQRLERSLHKACSALAELDIPDALIHADLTGGNVLVTAHGTIFLDWAESYIGNPLISAELLLASASLLDEDDRQLLRQLHIRQLLPNLNEVQTQFAVAIMPVLGPLALVMIGWRHGVRMNAMEHIWPGLRSLTRRVRDAIQEFEVSMALTLGTRPIPSESVHV